MPAHHSGLPCHRKSARRRLCVWCGQLRPAHAEQRRSQGERDHRRAYGQRERGRRQRQHHRDATDQRLRRYQYHSRRERQ